ncbi:MAG: SCO family protein [Balneolaceae bacterium]|nr:SCO family protein [Balneolaceae bacterium]
MKYVGHVLLVAVLFLHPEYVFGQLNQQQPRELQNVGIEERLGEKIPLDLRFADAEGDSVTLGQLMQQGKPVLLNPVYYECPQLCTLVIEAVLRGVEEVTWNPGDDYTIVTFSIDPGEGPELAARERQRILEKLGRRGAGEGWHFLTGKEPAVRALTEAIGYKYEKLERNAEYAHGAGVMFASPQGVLTRYLYGISFTGFNFRNALYEAADGNIGSTVEQALLYCYSYDPSSQSYVPVAWRIMKLGALVVLLFLGIFLAFMWLREGKNKSRRDWSLSGITRIDGDEENPIIETKIIETNASD